MLRYLGITLLAAVCFWPMLSRDEVATVAAQGKKKKDDPKLKEPPATPAETLTVAKDFKVELLYSVPKDVQGSWVSMCVDPKGRLIVSDQYGGLYRVTPPAIGGKASDMKLEKIPIKTDGKDFGDAHGLLWAFDSLYAIVNSNRIPSGLYRLKDSDGDDMLDKIELLHKLQGGQREHGPHAVLLNPDGKGLTVVCGNQEPVTTITGSRVPRHWGEDHLLPRMPDGNGFMAGVLGPGGCIYTLDPDGKNWELQSTGYRNQFDAAYNRHGDLFTYDADMEWDFNTPWYRPTRICLAASGCDYGWRNGAGKWPSYYADTLPSVVDVGPGSPTGVCFGYGAKFPTKYQNALFICDWSYGKLYAVHIAPNKSAYKGELEEFVSGTPLPLTDVVVNPKDGALYFTIGGRKTKSGLYRVTYAGKESTSSVLAPDAPVSVPGLDDKAREERRRLESFHGKVDSKAIETAWAHLKPPGFSTDHDRLMRSAARVILEHQDPKLWKDKALTETEPQAALESLLALVRVSSDDPQHKKTPVDEKLKSQILDALAKIEWAKLSGFQQSELLRIYSILFVRMGPPDEVTAKKLIERFDAVYPASARYVNADLCQMLVYLQAPNAAAKTLKLLADAPTQEEQLEYARSLRMLKTGWTSKQREEYFKWFLKAANYRGGNSFNGFMNRIKSDAIATLTSDEKTALNAILTAKPEAKSVFTGPPRAVVKKYAIADIAPLLDKGLTNRDFDNGRKMFGVGNCFACHRFDNEGGAHGPDLSQAAGRFSQRDLLESIVEPHKVISDQYAAHIFEMDDGRKVSGRIINLNNDNIMVMPNMMEPNSLVSLDTRRIEAKTLSKVSLMPDGLLDTLKEDEILDLMAYLLSRGDRSNKMFKK